MKTRIYSLLVALMSVVAFSACDDWTPAEQGAYPANTGGVSRSKMDVTVNDEVTAIGRAIVDTSDYLVTVTEKGSDVIATYEGKPCSWTYSTMPQIFTLPVGDYTVRVRSHEPADAAWSEPYYEGSADFTVVNNNVTYIGTVTCDFASVKVEIRFSEELAKAMSDDSHVDVVAGVAGTSLTWAANETRYGYFYPAEDNPTIIATFTGTVKGQTVSATKNVTDAKRGNYYIFSFSLNTGNPILPDEFGDITGADSGIKIDFEVIESSVNSTVRPGETPSTDPDKHPDTEEWPEEPGPGPDQPGPDQPENPDDKVIDFIGKFVIDDESSELYGKSSNLVLGEDGKNDPNADVHIVRITAQNGISNLKVKISSDNDDFIGSAGEMLPMDFDLATVDEDLAASLASIGLPVRDEVVGKTKIDFDITELAPLLSTFTGKHKFTITVIDAKGNTKSTSLIYVAE